MKVTLHTLKFPRDIRKAMREYFLYKRIPAKRVLSKLYWEYGLSQCKVAKLFGVSQITISRWLKRYNIKARNRADAASVASTKYPKKPFQGCLEEKAYMIGFALGDLTVFKHWRLIGVITSTTCSSMIQLLHRLFDPYSVVKKYPNRKRGNSESCYHWVVYCYLDKSFSFLLQTNIPKWILKNEKRFYAFLAGFTDAEGSICITHERETYIQRRFFISNTRTRLLRVIRDRLVQLGYSSRISGIDLIISEKDSVIKLLSRLPFKHPKMIRRRRLLLETINAKYWDEIKDKVMALRKLEKEDFEECIRKAREKWLQEHKTR